MLSECHGVMILTFAQFDLLKNWMETRKYENDIFFLPLGAAACACCSGACRWPAREFLLQAHGSTLGDFEMCSTSSTSGSPTPYKDSAESLDLQPEVVRGNIFFLV